MTKMTLDVDVDAVETARQLMGVETADKLVRRLIESYIAGCSSKEVTTSAYTNADVADVVTAIREILSPPGSVALSDPTDLPVGAFIPVDDTFIPLDGTWADYVFDDEALPN